MKRLLRILTPILVLGLFLPGRPVLGAGDVATEAADLVPAGATTTSNDQIGLCFVSSAEAPSSAARYARAVAAGVGWDRWPIYWGNVEKSQGSYDYSTQDRVVRDDVTYGLKTDAILLGTPSFYATGGAAEAKLPALGELHIDADRSVLESTPVSAASTTPSGLYTAIFSDGTDTPGSGKTIHPNNPWAQFVYRTVSRYKPGGAFGGGVSTWEIWNEPDYSLFWSGSAAQYYRLLQVAYIVAKYADPSCTVLAGGLAIYLTPSWLDTFMAVVDADPNSAAQTANGHYFDGLPLHIYSTTAETLAQTSRVRSILTSHGLGAKPLWINESGVPVWNDYPGPTSDPSSLYRATMDEQASYVLQNMAVALYSGAEKLFHFQLYDDCGNSPAGTNDVGDAYGIYRNPSDAVCFHSHSQPDTARPAATALQLGVQRLNGARPLWRKTSAGAQQVGFWKPATGERITMLWATTGDPVSVTIQAVGTSATRIDQAGGSQALSPVGGSYSIPLAAATNRNLPDHSYMIGGRTLLLVELDTTAPDATVLPMPPNSSPQFTVYWRGQDEGSGVANYDVYCASDGGALVLWKSATAATSAVYTGAVGHRYGFAVRARDGAGNVGAVPSAPQAETSTAATTATPTCTPGNTPTPTSTPSPTRTATPGAAISGQVANNRGEGVSGATVRLVGPQGTTTTVSTAGGSWQAGGLAPGAYGVSASAPGYGEWAAPRRLTLSGNLSGVLLNLPPSGNRMANGDLELGLGGWTLGGSTTAIADADAFDGAQALALGRNFQGQPELLGGGNCTAYQTVTIPDGGGRLSLMVKLSSSETASGHDWFEVIVIDDGAATYLIEPHAMWQTTNGWRQLTYDVSPWSGRSVMVVLNVYQDSPERPTVALVDEVCVGLSGASTPTTATPTPSASRTATRTPTRSPSETASVTATASRTQTATRTPTATLTRTPAQTRTATATRTASRTATLSASSTPTRSATPTPTPTMAVPTPVTGASLLAHPVVIRYDETVQLLGGGFRAGEPIVLEIHAPGGSSQFVWVYAGSDGAFSADWPATSGKGKGIYAVSAYGVSGATAQTTFALADGSVQQRLRLPMIEVAR